MEECIVELYSDADLRRLKHKVKGWNIGLTVLSAAALAVCVVMAALTGTANAAQMELAVIIINIAVGWLVIYCSIFVAAAGRHELEHAKMLSAKKPGEERTRIAGIPVVTDQRIVIRRSITARRVEVHGDGEVYRLLVCESRAKALAKSRAIALYAIHGYVAAYER